jgi:hypothetical protein
MVFRIGAGCTTPPTLRPSPSLANAPSAATPATIPAAIIALIRVVTTRFFEMFIECPFVGSQALRTRAIENGSYQCVFSHPQRCGNPPIGGRVVNFSRCRLEPDSHSLERMASAATCPCDAPQQPRQRTLRLLFQLIPISGCHNPRRNEHEASTRRDPRSERTRHGIAGSDDKPGESRLAADQNRNRLGRRRASPGLRADHAALEQA